MRKIPVEQAVGQVLCHDMTAILEGGFKGVKFKRGHMITEADVTEMLDMGKASVFVWEPEADEVHEEDAAWALAQAIGGENLDISGPSEGKYQISAAKSGLFQINREALRQINSVDDYTVVSRPGDSFVVKGDKLAALRIVPLVTKRTNVEAAVAVARQNFPVFKLTPYTAMPVGIIVTGNEIFYGRIKDRFEPVLREKLEPYGADVKMVTLCSDDLEMIISTVHKYVDAGVKLILLTGGMSVDPDDLTPTAIRQSGARVVTQGVPMQPGNMLMLAYLGDVMLVGVPSAALHSTVTSLDVFLPRIMAGVEITKEEISAYGEGGLCLGCERCSYPKCYFGN